MIYRALYRMLFGEERGQALPFLAILMPVLMVAMLLTVEGGRTMVDYRQMQSSADMAAVVGAQSLPCSTTDHACVATAEASACTYATKNAPSVTCASQHDASGNTVATTATPMAAVPPVSCSPFKAVPYGNSGNASCNIGGAQATPSSYNYIEVRLSKQVSVPWYPNSINFNLFAHAVARHGASSETGYAITQLDPTTPISFGGKSDVVTGSIFANGGVSGSPTVCNGGVYSPAAIGSTITGNQGGTPQYSTPDCIGGTSIPSGGGNAAITDPYASSSPPPTTAATFANCPECAAPGWWYDTKWHQGGAVSSSADTELWPGTYTSMSFGGGMVYFNPGVYTFTSGFDGNHATMCVYGAPVCNDSQATCYDSTFSPGDANAGLWYHTCSPYGYWDPATTRRTGSFYPTASQLPTSGPTYWDTKANAASTVPLNGVTIYMPVGSTPGIKEQGNGGKNGNQTLAAPNPCPGTGASTSTSVDWPSGAASATYTYAAGQFPSWLSVPSNTTAANTAGYYLYPSMDWSVTAECNNSLLVWPGEMPSSQHLHFLFWMADPGAGIDLHGTPGMKYVGLVYIPKGTVSLSGNANTCHGSHACGGPMITGQLVANDISVGGAASLMVYYRACTPGVYGCSGGLGTQLVQ